VRFKLVEKIKGYQYCSKCISSDSSSCKGCKCFLCSRFRKVGGRRRRVARRRYGRGLFSASKSAHDWLKSNKVISTVSKALDSAGVPYAGKIANVSEKLGYGRSKYRSRKRRTTRRVGRGLTFFSLSQIARPKF